MKIKKVLVALLNEENKVSSWGISNISVNEESVTFHVEGLIYKGNVLIKNDDINYEIYFNANKITTCSINDLVNVLDINIERTSNYIQDLESWLSSDKITR